ncbi:MAG: hypothetical protein IKH18_04710 [Clostridia bacterium]|nr:hypothetical protein [Clostridia bacterium]
MAKRKGIRQILGKILRCLLALMLAAFLYVVLIIGQPQSSSDPALPPQPLLTPSPAVRIDEETGIKSLVSAFPVPVMSAMSGSGLIFVSGTSADAPYHGGFGRILTLNWQTEDAQPMMLQSIYPAEAVELMGKGEYHFSNIAGPVLFSRKTVRMEDTDTIRIHTATEDGLYVLTIPRSLTESLPRLSRSIQLFTAE